MLIFSFYFTRFNKLFGLSIIILGVSTIGMGITRILEERGYLNHKSIASLSPAIGFLIFIIMLYYSARQMGKDNPRLLKMMRVAFILFLICFLPMVLMLIYLNYFD